MPLISVIIPIYNAEKYIKQCVNTVLYQSFTDFELLLIDDGSSDSSGKICDAYMQMDNRIRVFHKTNGGVSSARNLGIKESKGKWIAFIDADDFIDKNYLKILLKNSAKSDFISCGYKIIDELGNEKDIFKLKQNCFNVDNIEKAINNNCIDSSPWGHLINADLIKKNNLTFELNRSVGEDAVFILKCLSHAKQVQNIQDVLYFYRMTPTSLLHPNDLKLKKFIEDFEWSNNQIKGMDKGKYFFYYKCKCSALMVHLYHKDKYLVKKILRQSQEVSGKGEFFYWLKMPWKKQILMTYICFPRPLQSFVQSFVYKLCLKK